MFAIIQTLDQDIQNLILSQIQSEINAQQFTRIMYTIIIIMVPVVVVACLLWYFLAPRSPYVKRRAEREKKKEGKELEAKREEQEARQKIEQREALFKQKLQELNYTCKNCHAPGLTGPKCEYCGHINFSID